MKLPTYKGWPIIANYSPIEGTWCLKTRRYGHASGVIGMMPLRECLRDMLEWFAREDNEKNRTKWCSTIQID